MCVAASWALGTGRSLSTRPWDIAPDYHLYHHHHHYHHHHGILPLIIFLNIIFLGFPFFDSIFNYYDHHHSKHKAIGYSP